MAASEMVFESIERALPPVYSEKYEELIVAAGHQLCLQATNQTRFIQLFQALCTQITTPQAVAFTCQVFRNLGCTASELQTLQKQYPQCELDDPVIARLYEIKEQIKNEIDQNMLTLDGQLDQFYVSIYCLVLYVFHAKQRVQTERKTFYELFCLLSEGLPLQLAVDITYFALKSFNCYPAVALIEKYITPNYCLEIDKPEVHLRLRVAKFFLSLSEQHCKLAILNLKRHYLNNRAIDTDTPIEFVQVLCESNTVTVDNLDNIKDIAKNFHRSHLFDGSSLGNEEHRKSYSNNVKQFMITKPVIGEEEETLCNQMFNPSDESLQETQYKRSDTQNVSTTQVPTSDTEHKSSVKSMDSINSMEYTISIPDTHSESGKQTTSLCVGNVDQDINSIHSSALSSQSMEFITSEQTELVACSNEITEATDLESSDQLLSLETDNPVLEVSDIQCEHKCVNTQGVVTKISDILISKNSSEYFKGYLTDGKSSLRLVSFDIRLHKKLFDAASNSKRQQSVILDCCEIKEVYGTLQITLSNHTEVRSSSKVYDLSDMEPKHIKINDIHNIRPCEHVNVSVKVISVDPPEQIHRKNVTKQLFLLGDSTLRCYGIAWEENIGKVEKGKSYSLSNAIVTKFKQICISTDTDIQEIDDIGEVSPDILGHGSIIAVSINHYIACVKCKRKVGVEDDIDLGSTICCQKCGTKMKTEKCSKEIVGKIIVESNKGGKKYFLTAFTSALKKMVQDNEEVNKENLLKAPSMIFVADDEETISSVIKTEV